jgi:SAM-dependent methyltransferase
VDVVVSLFHVMSYQVENQDLADAFASAAANLRPGGLLVFDCWHGPGVLTDPPATRIRRMQGDGFEVTRLAEPVMHPGRNRVDVNYEILVEREGRLSRINERHRMRYLFTPELDLLLASAGLKRISCTRWMDDQAPGLSDWNACYVATR